MNSSIVMIHVSGHVAGIALKILPSTRILSEKCEIANRLQLSCDYQSPRTELHTRKKRVRECHTKVRRGLLCLPKP